MSSSTEMQILSKMHAWPHTCSTTEIKASHMQMDLTLEDECQIRDRSTIMARHLFSEGGDHFADEQVGFPGAPFHCQQSCNRCFECRLWHELKSMRCRHEPSSP